MAGSPNHGRPGDVAPPTSGSPTRRRLLALLAGLPVAGPHGVGVESSRALAARASSSADPMPARFAEFRALLDRHAATLATCDRLEAKLTARVGYPRVTLPPDAVRVSNYAADAATIAQAVPPGRRRQRLRSVLQGRQRRWDAAALEVGLAAAQLHEATLDGAVLAAADGLLATPAWTLDAVVLKLIVLIGTQEPGPSACETSPWRELRLILHELSGLAASAEPEQ